MVSICIYTESSKRFLKSIYHLYYVKFSFSLFQILSFALFFFLLPYIPFLTHFRQFVSYFWPPSVLLSSNFPLKADSLLCSLCSLLTLLPVQVFYPNETVMISPTPLHFPYLLSKSTPMRRTQVLA